MTKFCKAIILKKKKKSSLKTQRSKNKNHGILSHHIMANRWGKMETVTDFIFVGFKITVDSDYSYDIKDACSLEEKVLQT